MVSFRNELIRFADQFDNYEYGDFLIASQHDGQECLRIILDALHEALIRSPGPRPKFTYTDTHADVLSNLGKATLSWNRSQSIGGSSVISDVFGGQIESVIRCGTCAAESATYDTFFDLSVPIPSGAKKVRLEDCLADFAKVETLDGEWKCPRCKCPRTATKQVLISKVPQVLVISLNRFDFTYGYTRKIGMPVEIPVSGLDVDGILSETLLGKGEGDDSKFNLFATVNHMGVAGGGHYNAFVNYDDNEWFTKDDTQVRHMNESSLQSPSVYILFYHKY